ncbi:MAG: ATP-dependent RecD-like DNA helicase [Clostridioides sp.]|jgi:exodeoxyribonuclease V alpha subunit|nr:ATP-dependent RecD-like DNA helicase [Clostridioides sp.]
MEKLEGIISDIIFRNEDNAYTVANLTNQDDEIVVVGCMPTVEIGETIEVVGKWTSHKLYGSQFQVESFKPLMPTSLEGIHMYLASGVISGIGEKTAKRIIDVFGLRTLDVIQNEPYELTKISGIGKKTVDRIVKSYEEDKELRNIILQLSPYGVTPNLCMKIYRKYKEQSLSIISENPYRLAEEVKGIGFKIADNIASNIGIAKNSPDRIQQGILFLLNGFVHYGHTCIPRENLLRDSVSLLEVNRDLVEQCLIELVFNKKVHIERIEGIEFVYLMKYFEAENSVCSKLIKLSQYKFKDKKKLSSLTKPIQKKDDKNNEFSSLIQSIQQEENISLADKQKEAINACSENGVVIITGGPGTGKTTTINTIIKVFEKQRKKVLLTAPTGRAAKRMSETSNRESKTIHRLLEIGRTTEDDMYFFRNSEQPLDADVVIVDEVSMVDISLMAHLLDAIKLGTRLILVGDSDQLPSVSAGNVLSDLINSEVIKVVRLTEIFRQAQESMIVVNAHRINNGLPLELNSKDKDFFFINKSNEKEIADEIIGLVDKRLPNFYKVDKMKDIQILTPMRKGELGVNNLNSVLQNFLNPKEKYKAEEKFATRTFRVGDKVMQIKNNYAREWTNEDETNSGEGVYNGDIGYIHHIDKEDKLIYVIYDSEKIVEYPFSDLDELEHSFCTTIHKSQGSEFPVIVIPISWAPPMLLTRNLLYTAVTRAKKLVVMVGNVKYLEYMIKNKRTNDRYSNLNYKLGKFKKEGLIE